jgi:hypothetical protein
MAFRGKLLLLPHDRRLFFPEDVRSMFLRNAVVCRNTRLSFTKRHLSVRHHCEHLIVTHLKIIVLWDVSLCRLIATDVSGMLFPPLYNCPARSLLGCCSVWTPKCLSLCTSGRDAACHKMLIVTDYAVNASNFTPLLCIFVVHLTAMSRAQPV